jgi:quinol monooxygenase YgiN
MLVRQYSFQIASASTDAFFAALGDLVTVLKGVEGFAGAELLRDNEDLDGYVFTERWISLDAYKDGAQLLPGTIFKSLKETLKAPPKAAFLTPVVF